MIDLSAWLWPGAGLGLVTELQQLWWYFSSGLWLVAAVFSLSFMAKTPQKGRYWLFFGLSFAGNMLLIAALDAISFYIGFSVMSLSAYGLVVHSGDKSARRAGRLYLQLAVMGELLLFAALILRASAADGQYDWQSWQQVPLDHLTILLTIAGLGLKAGFWPLHIWLPQAHPAAPAPASAVLSGAMIKAGVLGLVLFLPGGDPQLQLWVPYMICLGFFSAGFGVLASLLYRQPKVILAYSSVSQVGYVVILVALAWTDNAAAVLPVLMAYAAHHAVAKGALFLFSGINARQRLPAYWQLLFWLPALALMAIPLSGGAAIKTALKGLFSTTTLPGWLDSGMLAGLLSLGALLTALLFLHLAAMLRQQQRRLGPGTGRPDFAMHWQGACVLLLILVLIWLPWQWQPLLQLSLTTLAWPTIWTLCWPLVLALLLVALVRWQQWQLPPHYYDRNSSVLLWSLWLKRLYQPQQQWQMAQLQLNWRPVERALNRLAPDNVVGASALLIVVLLVVASAFW
ncbi:Formate hydrogenlyase subunit 3/Multisubunit Na+/H+ antiporter, MnhD subunit [Arsukibacterium tuosuense]|uniref:Formate hydrogenlyase subunit 3/Multisubunit Na+/H+ antiporter, MnhD subunit n=1 Tax=Arsukibacterium tuosuense TaxID=1323745 RepID=A0A285IAX5_9GAMM|nr:complex I subunit 5 family protein [Arsukibacterium tuosuense]SNY45125.1 Formate hydrogenlyase subunit 3/Multisubunit Na+/H+ antiporter, MnhD subunit [Arsukibacterium tuosuense]